MQLHYVSFRVSRIHMEKMKIVQACIKNVCSCYAVAAASDDEDEDVDEDEDSYNDDDSTGIRVCRNQY